MADNVATSGTAAVIGGATTENAVLIQGTGAVFGGSLTGSTVTGTASVPQTSSAEGTANTPAASPASAAVPAPNREIIAEPVPKVETKSAQGSPKQEPVPAVPSAEVEALKIENAVLRAGIKPGFSNEAASMAKSRMKDGVTFEQALETVIADFPTLKGAPETIMSPSVSISNDSAAANEAEDAKIDAIMGIKPTKKEG